MATLNAFSGHMVDCRFWDNSFMERKLIKCTREGDTE